MGKWLDLANGFDLYCSFGEVSNCLLKDQLDLMNMTMLAAHLSIKMINAHVIVKDSVLPPPPPPKQVRISSEVNLMSNFEVGNSSGNEHSNTGEQAEFAGMQRPPAFPVCPDITITPLLSLEWKEAITGVGQCFRGGHAEFRTELIKYSTMKGFLYYYGKNNGKYVYAYCMEKSNGCNWFIRGKHDEATGLFIITKCLLVHLCGDKTVKADNRRLGPKIWGKLILENVKGNPKKPSTAMKQHMKLAYGVDVKYNKAYRSVLAAKNHIHGTYATSFDGFKWYTIATIKYNPGSVAFVQRDSKTRRFKRSFFAWFACLEGFKSCRPMISVDATHMHGRWRGVILSATGKDGNNGLFPIAIALVACENLENWVWFLEQLREHVKHVKQIFFLSDRNTGLMSAFPIVFENPQNFYCLFHLHNNLRSYYAGSWPPGHRDSMCALLTECAYAPTETARA